MRKTLPYYIVFFISLVIILLFFDTTYHRMKNYAALTSRHNAVLSIFQNLSRQINNAAALTPDLTQSTIPAKAKQIFYTDRRQIMEELNLLRSTVYDSINVRIAARLEKIVKSEIDWILKSDVPDSIIANQSPDHIAKMLTMDSLIASGVTRTNYLIQTRKTQLNKEIVRVKIWMTAFIILSGIVIINISFRLLGQQTKTKLKEKELEIVLNRINDGVVSVDNEWRYTFLNDAAMATHPLNRKETMGKVIWDVHPEMKGTIFWDKYHEAMETKTTVEIENYYPPMNIWFSVKVYPSADGLTIFYNDITETKKAEHDILKLNAELDQKVLERTNELLQAKNELSQTLEQTTFLATIADNIQDPVIATDNNSVITKWNKAAEKLLEWKSEEVIGKSSVEILKGIYPHGGRAQVLQSLDDDHFWQGEAIYHSKSGNAITVLATASDLKDAGNNRIGYLVLIRDITDRMKAEEQLKEFRHFFNNSNDLSCIANKEGYFEIVNPSFERLLGYDKNELSENPFFGFVHPDDLSSTLHEYEKLKSGATVLHFLNRYRKKDGQYLWFEWNASPNTDTGKLYCIARDITARKKAEDRLGKLNSELEAFSYSVSHDLRAPLRGIIGFTSILEEEYAVKLDDEAKRIAGIIKNNATKMAQLIDDLLAFSRSGKQELSKVTVDTMGMIDKIIDEYRHDPKHATVRWEVHPMADIKGDPNTLRQVWINLLSNAIKYSANKLQPVIEIGCKEEKHQIIFYVKDNGAGFDENYSNKLFKVFQRLHTTEEFEGTGVGLALVEKIISRHEGQVWAEGKTDEGACFYFSLPV